MQNISPQVIIKLISKQLDQKRDQVNLKIVKRLRSNFMPSCLNCYLLVKMTQMEHPSFTYETMEMKEKILVRDWLNWLVSNIKKQPMKAKEFAQLVREVLKQLPRKSQIYQQSKGVKFLFENGIMYY